MIDGNHKKKMNSYLNSQPQKMRIDVDGALSKRDDQLKSK